MTCRTYLSGDGPVVTGPAGQRLNNSGVVADVWEIYFCEDRQVIADGIGSARFVGPAIETQRERGQIFGVTWLYLASGTQCSDALYLTGLSVTGCCPTIHSR